jgi:hypothetical protein
VFGAAPEPQYRDRLDGRAGGRGNSSSVAGGIFGAEETIKQSNVKSDAERYGSRSNLSSLGSSAWGDGKDDGFGGFGFNGYQAPVQKQNNSMWEGAAGGKSTNAGQVRDGHFRGSLGGTHADGAGGRSSNAGQVRDGHFRGGTRRQEQRPTGGFDDDFLSRLGEAEQRDEEDAAYLASLQQQAASDMETVVAAAAQIAAEQGLDIHQEEELCQKLLSRLQQQAQENQMIAQAKQPSARRPSPRAPSPRAARRAGSPRRGGACERTSSKVLAPPGGRTSICLG